MLPHNCRLKLTAPETFLRRPVRSLSVGRTRLGAGVNIRQLFDVFSRRKRRAEIPLKPLTVQFRNRVLMLCRDRFSSSGSNFGSGDNRQELWIEMHRRLAYLIGRPRLSNNPQVQDEIQDVLQFLSNCGDEHFLDFVEYIFRLECYWRACTDENTMVEEINHLFLLEDLPYALTPFVREARTEDFLGGPREVQALVSYPKVVLRDHQIPYSEAISPAIQLLADQGFSSANLEFLGALEDYRKGRYGDCLTKCGSAFESTMKHICTKRSWPYQQSDGAAQLLRVILPNSRLENYFEQPLLTIATLRNRLSTSHGAGTQQRAVSPHKARYAINATAAAILLLVEECG